jgi:dolichol-phosphate mannosyltransferase
MEKPIVSIVFSFRNEEAVLEELVRRTTEALDSTNLAYELIFVNDTSTDRSLDILKELRTVHPNIKILNTSFRFGVNPCIIAGMKHASGDCVITLDSDLQDPPELMPDLIKKWQDGGQVVYTTRVAREGEPWLKMWLTRRAYGLISRFSEVDLPVNSGMYKLLDRRVIDELLAIDEYEPYLRGLISWVGFNQVSVPYERDERFAGETHFKLLGKGPVTEFMLGIISFSQWPLYWILLAGIAIALISGLLTVTTFITALAMGWKWRYVAFFAVMALGGLQLAAIGILGLYVGRIYNQSKGRPKTIIAEKIGFDDED